MARGRTLAFLDSHHLLRWLGFVSAVAPNDDQEKGDEYGFSKLYYRIAPWSLVTHSHPDRWRYTCRPFRDEPGGNVFLESSVEFPRRDIPVLQGLLAEAVDIHRGEQE